MLEYASFFHGIYLLFKLAFQVSIPVSTQIDEWIAAEVLRDDFILSQERVDVAGTVADSEHPLQANVDIFARFLAFIAQRTSDASDCAKARISLLTRVFTHFVSSYLTDTDLYSFVNPFDAEVRTGILAAYFAARATLENHNVADIAAPPASALLTAADDSEASIYALFGGQGTNEVYFDELQSLYDTYKPYVSPIITSITNDILLPLVSSRQGCSFYNYGMNVAAWLAGTSPRPPVEYLASIPVSLPLIGLTQLVQYLVICHVSGFTPGELRDHFAGATGHSQGVVSAIAISASTSIESFNINAKKALRWLFFCGMRGQEAFPVLALEPSIVQDCIDGGEGEPTPMLSVTNLSLDVLQPHLDATNDHLPTNAQIAVSLFNGPRNFVVTGPSRSLCGLVTNLRKVRASSGLDQSKVPFSQRKPAFGVRFLVVNAPYHSAHLKGAAEKLCDEDLEGEELWTKEELGIPVFNTEDGAHIVTSKHVSG